MMNADDPIRSWPTDRSARWGERAANVLLAVVIGIVGAAVLVHWLSCEVC